jgi:hypothetical protein
MFRRCSLFGFAMFISSFAHASTHSAIWLAAWLDRTYSEAMPGSAQLLSLCPPARSTLATGGTIIMYVLTWKQQEGLLPSFLLLLLLRLLLLLLLLLLSYFNDGENSVFLAKFLVVARPIVKNSRG